MSILRAASAVIVFAALSSCAFHPRGEREERDLARRAYEKSVPAPLSSDASLGDILQYAYHANAELEARYWEWRAAIEQIPQDASMPTVPAVSLESMFEDGATSLAHTTIALGNDPMTNIPWPGKVTAAGRRALELARAAGARFEEAKLELRTKVLDSYYDYALLAESIRLKEAGVSLLRGLREDAQSRVRAAAASGTELLKSRTELDLALNELETLNSTVPGRLAAMNAILGREPTAPVDLPKPLPPARDLPLTDSQILARLAERNPELASLAHEIQAGESNLSLMRRQYIPDLGLSIGADLEGIATSIMAMLTAPFVRFEAIRASISQAEAELAAARAMRAQAERDLKARAVLALYDMRNAERQATLFEQSLIPRTEQIVQITRASYSAGQAPLTDFLDSERMLVDMRLMYAEMRMEREKLLAEVEGLSSAAR